MISYIFTEQELKYLCGIMKTDVLPLHMINGSEISDSECRNAKRSLEEKGFIEIKNELCVINSVIAFLFRVMASAERIFVGNGNTKFTAFIGKCSVLLSESFGQFVLSPFENEAFLVAYLRENGLTEWSDIRLE